MKILYTLIASVFILGIFIHNTNADELKKNTPSNKYKYEFFLINPTENNNKFLYTAEELGGIDDSINREIKDIRVIMKPGSYIRITDFYYNALIFKLNSILYNKENNFYLNLKKKSYYYFIYCDKNMFPQIKELNDITGYNIIKNLIEVKK